MSGFVANPWGFGGTSQTGTRHVCKSVAAAIVAGGRWPRDGISPNPAGRIVTTVPYRAIDIARRPARGRGLHEHRAAVASPMHPAGADTKEEDGPVSDDQLRLIFACSPLAL